MKFYLPADCVSEPPSLSETHFGMLKSNASHFSDVHGVDALLKQKQVLFFQSVLELGEIVA
jgi:hypothetical protein